MDRVAFVILAILALLGGIGVVFSRKPVHAAVSLVLNFFVLAFLYFTLAAQFLGITQIMVYAGAIMVLFLFVVMILKLTVEGEETDRADPKRALGWFGGVALFALLFLGVVSPMVDTAPNVVRDDYGAPQMIGRVLFTSYAWPFLIASVLLLVGIVGSMLLAKRRLR